MLCPETSATAALNRESPPALEVWERFGREYGKQGKAALKPSHGWEFSIMPRRRPTLIDIKGRAWLSPILRGALAGGLAFGKYVYGN